MNIIEMEERKKKTEARLGITKKIGTLIRLFLLQILFIYASLNIPFTTDRSLDINMSRMVLFEANKLSKQMSDDSLDPKKFSQINLLTDVYTFLTHLFVKSIIEEIPEEKVDFMRDQMDYWVKVYSDFYMYNYYSNYYYNPYYTGFVPYSDWLETKAQATSSSDGLEDGYSSSSDADSSDEVFVEYIFDDDEGIRIGSLFEEEDEFNYEVKEDLVFSCFLYCHLEPVICLNPFVDRILNKDDSETILDLGGNYESLTSFGFRVTFMKDRYEVIQVDLDSINEEFFIYNRNQQSPLKTPTSVPDDPRTTFLETDSFLFTYDTKNTPKSSFEKGGFNFKLETNGKFEDFRLVNEFFYQYVFDMDVNL